MFDELLPDFVASFSSLALPAEALLLESESEQSQSFAASRLKEFTHGRYCARQALASLGKPAVAIEVGESRQPVWPQGIVGSITHSQDFAAAAAGTTEQLAGLGIDCEQQGRLDEKIQKRISLPSEIEAAGSSGLAEYGSILFSAKESVYKCIWPTVRHFVGFKDVELTLDIASSSYTAKPANDKLCPSLLSGIQGRWLLVDGRVLTCALILSEDLLRPGTNTTD